MKVGKSWPVLVALDVLLNPVVALLLTITVALIALSCAVEPEGTP